MSETLQSDVGEVHDAPELLAEKLERLLTLCRRAEHMVVFTGAGISTSVGLPDYRGPLPARAGWLTF